MSPALMTSLIQAGLATMVSLRTARSENPGVPISLDLMGRLRAEFALLSDQLDRDIQAELARRADEPNEEEGQQS